jgi:hypothetical protein
MSMERSLRDVFEGRGELRKPKRVGFWANNPPKEDGKSWGLVQYLRMEHEKSVQEYPIAQQHVDPQWAIDNPVEWAAVVTHLRAGKEKDWYKGSSSCRLCGCINGSADMTDGEWVWPQGLLHYVIVHDVKPPNQEFIDHCVRELKRRFAFKDG